MKNKYLFITGLAVLSVGCTDAEFDRITRVFSKANVQCYSNGVQTLNDVSTGKVEFSENGAGFYYRSKNTNKLVQVIRSNCIIQEL